MAHDPRYDLHEDRFVTGDPQQAEEQVRTSYKVSGGVRMSGDTDDFRFSQHVLASRGFAITRFQCTIAVGYHGPLDDLLCVEQVHAGRLSFDTAHTELRTGAGDICLVPPHEPWRATTDGVDLAPLILDPAAVADHAAATCPIEPEQLRFTGLEPISPAHAGRWNATVAHVRDDILGNPTVAENPILVEGAFRQLAASLLSTFPNTALDALSGPTSPARPGTVTEATLREVVDYLHSQAAQPLGPADVAAVAGVPARDVDDTLRRHRNTSWALELWRARMQGAHRDLHDGDPEAGDTVAAIAARWGFTDPATFAVAYTLASGGESPEHTLRR
ncbi:helix-turn-helix domain-containing protein [Actinomycetospora sp. TBRC 11914]|uniref:helix-turn-helix domain-containing protein n=1 Tax=Actinomycetospora sp. TBRC 11914 TaxID=2729387 RepID=UPI00145E5DAC|nr:helix-turn-helix domain-containing protein [Actinomycetospora sp. TBRC 11914]NMO93162.1 AraC family transcriptional regulator [Actinomycetospora sp. TBRC 11914]